MADFKPRRIPKRLGKAPLVESLWELRFSSEMASVAELLPGLLFSAFDGEFQSIEPLPAANVPLQIRQINADFMYVPTVRLRGEHYTIQIGDRVVSLGCSMPYKGWKEFGAKIRALVKVLRKTKLISNPERFSMKYIDILPSGDEPTIAQLDVVITLGDQNINVHPLHLRTEVFEEGFLNIVQIISPANAQLLGGEIITGILVDNDTIYNHMSGDFWEIFSKQLDLVHKVNKKMFFNLLTESAITNLEPEY